LFVQPAADAFDPGVPLGNTTSGERKSAQSKDIITLNREAKAFPHAAL
jgi:hypothetical protein